jgi:hypothetical protein
MSWSPDDTFIASATSWDSGAGAPPEPLEVQVWVAPPKE